MKRKQFVGALIATQAAQSLAVAVAIVVLGHLVFWIAAEGVTVADELGGSPAHFEDQADAP
jgi:hypothetical protein